MRGRWFYWLAAELAAAARLATPHGIVLQQPPYSSYRIELGETARLAATVAALDRIEAVVRDLRLVQRQQRRNCPGGLVVALEGRQGAIEQALVVRLVIEDGTADTENGVGAEGETSRQIEAVQRFHEAERSGAHQPARFLSAADQRRGRL